MGYFADLQATKKYYADRCPEQCSCLYCQNYRAALEQQYPEVTALLRRMEVDPLQPLDITEWGAVDVRSGMRLYESLYVVKGLLSEDGMELAVQKGITVILYRHDTTYPAYQNISIGLKTPYFLVSIQELKLPWVLQQWPE